MSERSPVSPETLMRMAMHYLARHAASTTHLRQVLERKILRRCETRDLPAPPDADLAALIDAAVERLTGLGLLDDEAYARGRGRTLAGKGWPAWRIRAELDRQGIDPDGEAVAAAAQLDEAAQARRLAERRRLGPFRGGDRAPYRDRDIRSLVRAGFSVAVAQATVDDGTASSLELPFSR